MDTVRHADPVGRPDGDAQGADRGGEPSTVPRRRQILWYVQIPLLRPLIVIALLLRSIDASKIFDTVYVLTGGGPGDSTEMVTTFAHRTSFMTWNLGYGAAICLVSCLRLARDGGNLLQDRGEAVGKARDGTPAK